VDDSRGGGVRSDTRAAVKPKAAAAKANAAPAKPSVATVKANAAVAKPSPAPTAPSPEQRGDERNPSVRRRKRGPAAPVVAGPDAPPSIPTESLSIARPSKDPGQKNSGGGDPPSAWNRPLRHSKRAPVAGGGGAHQQEGSTFDATRLGQSPEKVLEKENAPDKDAAAAGANHSPQLRSGTGGAGRSADDVAARVAEKRRDPDQKSLLHRVLAEAEARDEEVTLHVGSLEDPKLRDLIAGAAEDPAWNRDGHDEDEDETRSGGSASSAAWTDAEDEGGEGDETMSELFASLEAMMEEDDDLSSSMTSQASTFGTSFMSAGGLYIPGAMNDWSYMDQNVGWHQVDDTRLAFAPSDLRTVAFHGEVGRFFQHSKWGTISPWHDVPLHAGLGTFGDLWMVTEVPSRTDRVHGVATSARYNPIMPLMQKGEARRYRQPIFWNYGFLPQTWGDPMVVHPELGARGGNGPVAVLEIGSRQRATGEVARVIVLGAFAIVDHGVLTWKILAVDAGDALAWRLSGIEDLEVAEPGLVAEVRDWLRRNAAPSGVADLAFDGRAVTRTWAMEVVEATHDAWRRLGGGEAARYGLWAAAPSPRFDSRVPAAVAMGSGARQPGRGLRLREGAGPTTMQAGQWPQAEKWQAHGGFYEDDMNRHSY